jgi:hypothetical protein
MLIVSTSAFPVIAQEESAPELEGLRRGVWFNPRKPNKVEVWVDVSNIPLNRCVYIEKADLTFFDSRNREIGRRTLNIRKEMYRKAKNSQHIFYTNKPFVSATHVSGVMQLEYRRCGVRFTQPSQGKGFWGKIWGSLKGLFGTRHVKQVEEWEIKEWEIPIQEPPGDSATTQPQ